MGTAQTVVNFLLPCFWWPLLSGLFIFIAETIGHYQPLGQFFDLPGGPPCIGQLLGPLSCGQWDQRVSGDPPHHNVMQKCKATQSHKTL